jgi:hypothetical protein
MIHKLSEEIGGFHESLKAEIEQRAKGQEALLRIIDDAHAALMEDLQQERVDREETEQSLIKLLDDTCHRIEQSIMQ